MKNKEKKVCPVCGKHEWEELGVYEMCPVCGWEEDAIQEEHPDDFAGPNGMSLNEYREAYEHGWREDWMNRESAGV